MRNNRLNIFILIVSLAVLTGCAAPEPADPGPPPPQNLIASTDELQLVTEVSLDLAREYGGESVLVVLEIDKTLLSMDPYPACDPASRDTVRPTQADAADQIRRMQEAGLRVIALTGRGLSCRDQTFRELSVNGFDFASSSWPPDGGYPDPFLPEGGNRAVMYQEGVFLTDGQDKGVMLKQLLEKSAVRYPRLIVMADAEQSDLNSVMKAFSWTPTKVHAWRYTRDVSVEVVSD